MKPLLNTLYITSQGAWVSKEGEAVCVRVGEETRVRVPVHTLSGIVCFGQVSCSPHLMAFAAEHGVGLSFLSEHGRFLARVQGPVHGNVLLRVAQYRIADRLGASESIARNFVIGKIANSRITLLRAARERDQDKAAEELNAAASRLGRIIDAIVEVQGLERIRGMEGEAARVYFSVFDHLIRTSREVFSWTGRSRRPPLDNLNALLSFVYTLLLNDIASALECVGLDPSVGYLHALRPGRPALALDLMEELRPVLADRLVLTMINRKQVSGRGFDQGETGGVVMNDDTRKEVLVAWQKRKQEELIHPFLDERMPVGLIPHVQATLLARHVRGDLDGYPPFFWR